MTTLEEDVAALKEAKDAHRRWLERLEDKLARLHSMMITGLAATALHLILFILMAGVVLWRLNGQS